MTLASTFRMFAALLLAICAATQPVQAERIKDLERSRACAPTS